MRPFFGYRETLTLSLLKTEENSLKTSSISWLKSIIFSTEVTTIVKKVIIFGIEEVQLFLKSSSPDVEKVMGVILRLFLIKLLGSRR